MPAFFKHRKSVLQKFLQWRNRTGDNDVGLKITQFFDSATMNDRSGFGYPVGFLKEGAFPLAAFDKVKFGFGRGSGDGQDQARQPCAAADVGDDPGPGRQMRPQLRRIEDMPPPDAV